MMTSRVNQILGVLILPCCLHVIHADLQYAAPAAEAASASGPRGLAEAGWTPAAVAATAALVGRATRHQTGAGMCPAAAVWSPHRRSDSHPAMLQVVLHPKDCFRLLSEPTNLGMTADAAARKVWCHQDEQQPAHTQAAIVQRRTQHASGTDRRRERRPSNVHHPTHACTRCHADGSLHDATLRIVSISCFGAQNHHC